jgi:D-alanyl-D-alanine carboxypeptidase
MKLLKIFILIFVLFLGFLFFSKNLDSLNKKNNLIQETKEEKLIINLNTNLKIEPKNLILFKKYSKVDFLDENYKPESLVQVDKKYLNKDGKNFLILEDVYPFLEKLLIDAQVENLSLQVLSVYRSYNYQKDLKNYYINNFGKEEADKFSADPGFSEHQLGSVLDFTSPEIGGKLTGFDKTLEYNWLLENAHKYGFVLSYPENNPYYKFEPWHWRFVGISLASKLFEENKYFYLEDQEVINQYSLY